MASAIDSNNNDYDSGDDYAGQPLPPGAPHPRYYEKNENSRFCVRFNDEFIRPYSYYFETSEDAREFYDARVAKIEEVIAKYTQIFAEKLATAPSQKYCPVCFADGRKLVRAKMRGKSADGESVSLCDHHAGESAEIEVLDLQDEAKRSAHSNAGIDGYSVLNWSHPKPVYKPEASTTMSADCSRWGTSRGSRWGTPRGSTMLSRAYTWERTDSQHQMLVNSELKRVSEAISAFFTERGPPNDSDEFDYSDMPELLDMEVLAGNPYAPSPC